RAQSDSLLRRVLVLRVPRGRPAIGRPGRGILGCAMAAIAEPAIYIGQLKHRRFLPRPHAFMYRLFMAFLDIDHPAAEMPVSPFTSHNRFNWASFDDRDHLGDPARPLRERLALDAARAGLTLPDGPIFLLTHLRYLGYAFNPISLYYCFNRHGAAPVVCA